MNSTIKLLFLATLLVGPATLASAQENNSLRLAHAMSIEGRGEYWVAPEVAEISGEVVTTGDTLAVARDGHPALAAKVRANIEGLASKGLKLDSARYSIRETFPHQYDTSPTLTTKDKEKSVFVATTTFALSTRNLTDIAELISVLGSGDLRIDNIHFTVKNIRAPLLEARKNAARDALEQATAYAGALGVKLVEIRSVTDGDALPPSYESADLAILMGPDGRPPLTIAVPNQLSYSASVTIDWTISGGAVTP